MAPANAYAIGLFVGAALAEIWRGAEEVEDDVGARLIVVGAWLAETVIGDGVSEIIWVEPGIVIIGSGAVIVEDTGTMTLL